MKIFTIKNGSVATNAKVDTFTLKGADVKIPAIIVGEEGRGRELGVLPVQLTPEKYEKWKIQGYTHISNADVGQTKSGRPKLIETTDTNDTDKAIVVFRTKIGYRGGNDHTGDVLKEDTTKHSTDVITMQDIIDSLNNSLKINKNHHVFPGEILTEGIIAQGDAGRMGSGEQLIAVMPANTVFRTAYTGRLYGDPDQHFYIFRDGNILAVTKEERKLTEIF